jgi:hypothetical protein
MAYRTKFDGQTDKTVTLGLEGNPASIEGYFLGSKDVASDYGPGKLHIFQTPEGTVGVWGKTRLNSALTKDLVGQMVLVEFTGMVAPKKKGRRPSYGFKVQHDPDNTIEVTMDLSGSAAAEDYEDEEGEEGDTMPVTSTQAYKTPSAADKARVQALLNGNKRA